MADIEAKPHGNVSVADLREETTWGRLIKRIQLQPQPGIEGKWTNADLDPTPPEQRNWTTWNYVFYWTNDATAPGNLRLGSSLWSMGLSWKLVLLTIALGHAIMTVALTFNGFIGARFHIPYKIQSRASFGFYFSFAMEHPVVCRSTPQLHGRLHHLACPDHRRTARRLLAYP
ncbi:permease for cytosine/purines, uracil, thiamine, allantoin-domain-containing protein [Phyllosticta citrichinensis]|uniref:Permease for cytosine/purines, uracil, thiamine, allantoin-domain-containing protein n=1 Tax=Phyllosticta citrichinensis TaxID=1130410 RepID=A0ABR1XP99_9PEZI